MESKSSRYQSRILREMHQNTENPFNSPPSSTGSHGTITLTSNLTMGPQGESTRRLDDMSINLPSQAALRGANAPQPASFNVNTSALGRTFPEWSRWNPSGTEHDKDMWETASDAAHRPGGKENFTPQGSPNSSVVATPRAEVSDRDKIETGRRQATTSGGTLRTRAQMQPRVQTESECSLDLSEAAAQPQRESEEHGARPRVPTPNAARGSKRRGNVTALLETLKTAQTKQAESREQPTKQPSSRSQALVQPRNAAQIHMERQAGISQVASPITPNQTARSFFLPNFSYINDFLSGTLKLSSLRNGMPVFVKHGRVHDRESTYSPDHHIDVEAIAIPEDEEKIFVSLDKIKDEIHALKEHDELVSRQAEQLQEEIEELHIQIAKYKSRKDSAMGSDSESSIIDHLNAQKSQLEEQVSSLQARLDKANRKISINEIHTESYIAERDEALKSATEHVDRIKQLQTELGLARQKLESLREDTTGHANTLELENDSLRKDNNSIRQQWKSMIDENRSLRQFNGDMSRRNAELEHAIKTVKVQLEMNKTEFETLQHDYEQVLEEKAVLKEDNLSLEHHNDKFFNDNKALKQQNSLLDRRMHDLKDEVARLQKLLEAAGGASGSMSVDLRDIKDRLEIQNQELAEENAELQQRIINMEAEASAKRSTLELEKRRLAAANEELKEQLEDASDRAELAEIKYNRIEKENSELYDIHHDETAYLNQQFMQALDDESELREELGKSADREAELQSKLNQKIEELKKSSVHEAELRSELEAIRKAADHEAQLRSQLKQKIDELKKSSTHEAGLQSEVEAIRKAADREAQLQSQLNQKMEELKSCASREAKLRSRMNLGVKAVKEARQISQNIKGILGPAGNKKQTKTTRVVEPKGKSTVGETTTRSTTSQTDMPIQDDYTQQIDLTQGPDFAKTQRKDLTTESSAFEDDMSEEASQSLPLPYLPQSQQRNASPQRTVSRVSKGRAEATKSQPIGILKDTQPSRLNSQKQKTGRAVTEAVFEDLLHQPNTANSGPGVRKSKSDDTIPRKVSFGRPTIKDGLTKSSRPLSETDLTGRFSVKSGVSGMSIQSETSEADKFRRRNSDSGRFDVDTDHEDNMTSALFIDDITLEQEKTAGKQSKKTTVAELSDEAKRVLDDLCQDHDCSNCVVCLRITSYGRTTDDGAGKKTVRVEKPVPVTNRARTSAEYEDQSTIRPTQGPGVALAKVLKSLEDEERHLELAIKRKEAVYNECNPAYHRTMWKNLADEIEKLRKARDLKRDQIYFLHDALLGQQASGQEMTEDFVDFTIISTMGKDDDWDGDINYWK
ncbi:hypothetical protein F5Y05DRAFT_392610 [Hypoxylon sp. FL0543]|nr:hypothetical protein F5Y05DRAFT_392610 [Hypoxylon sp. FL0543]